MTLTRLKHLKVLCPDEFNACKKNTVEQTPTNTNTAKVHIANQNTSGESADMYPNRHKGKRATHDLREHSLPRHTEGNPAQSKWSEPECITRQSICQYKQGPGKTSIARCQLCGVTTSCALTFLCCTTNMQSRSRCCARRIPLAQALNLHCSRKCLVTGKRRGA